MEAENEFDVGTAQQLLWEEHGFRMFIPGNALLPSETCLVSVKAIVSGDFQFPEGTEPVSAIYAISLSKPFRKPVKLELQHCVHLERQGQSKFMSFAVAPHDQPLPPYQFQLVSGGVFHPGSYYATIERAHFCFVVIIRSIRRLFKCQVAGETISDSGKFQ